MTIYDIIIDLPHYTTFIYSCIYYPQYPFITIVFGIRIVSDIVLKIFDASLISLLSYHNTQFHNSNYSKLIIYLYTIYLLLLYTSTIITCIIDRHIGLPMITINIIIDIILIISITVALYVISLKRVNQNIQFSDTTSKIIDAPKTEECSICREEYTIN